MEGNRFAEHSAQQKRRPGCFRRVLPEAEQVSFKINGKASKGSWQNRQTPWAVRAEHSTRLCSAIALATHCTSIFISNGCKAADPPPQGCKAPAQTLAKCPAIHFLNTHLCPMTFLMHYPALHEKLQNNMWRQGLSEHPRFVQDRCSAREDFPVAKILLYHSQYLHQAPWKRLLHRSQQIQLVLCMAQLCNIKYVKLSQSSDWYAFTNPEPKL